MEGDTDHNTFVVGTLELRGENELHAISFNEDTNEVWCQRVYSHPHEVWACATCPEPENQELVMTTYSTGAEQRTSLWRMDGLAERAPTPDASQSLPPGAEPMTELLQLGGAAPIGDSRGLCWNPVLPEQVATLRRHSAELWHLSHGVSTSSAAEAGCAPPPRDGDTFGCGRWDPHHAHSLGLGCGNGILTLDARTMRPGVCIESAHAQPIRSLDFNPNMSNVLLTGADDYYVRFWDLRKPSGPLLSLRAHSHWVTSAAYNRFHDQLVLSCGTDALVKLWHVASISSVPPSPDLDDPEPAETDEDGLIKVPAPSGPLEDPAPTPRVISPAVDPSMWRRPARRRSRSTSSPSSAPRGARPTRGSSPRSASTARS